MWICRSSYSPPKANTGWGFSLKRKKESSSSLGYTPSEGYFDKIQSTKKKVDRGWFRE
jgi:hypothetical protein